jgi:hypothetical protein
MDTMRRVVAVVFALFWAAALFGQEKQTAWIAASNNPDIQYRSQAFSRAKACYVDFRDQKQGTGTTTFDIVVSYNSTDLNSDGKPAKKTENEHIVTVPTRTGASRITACSAVTDARVTSIERR